MVTGEGPRAGFGSKICQTSLNVRQKSCMLQQIFVPLEETTLVFTMFLQHQGGRSSKTPLFAWVFSERVDNAVFCDVFSLLSVDELWQKRSQILLFFQLRSASCKNLKKKRLWLKKVGEAVWAQKCCKLHCFKNVPCILPAKKGPSQSWPVASSSGKRRPLHLPVQTDLPFHFFDSVHWKVETLCERDLYRNRYQRLNHW